MAARASSIRTTDRDDLMTSAIYTVKARENANKIDAKMLSLEGHFRQCNGKVFPTTLTKVCLDDCHLYFRINKDKDAHTLSSPQSN